MAKILLKMKQLSIFIPTLVVIFSISCVSIGKKEDKLIEQLKSENKVCSQNLQLFMRENDVLKSENIKYKKAISNLKSQNSILKSDLHALKEKYNNDKKMWENRYNSLNEKYNVFVKQSGEKLQKLTNLNKMLEQKLSNEIARLNEIIRKQDVEFVKQKEKMINDFAKKEIEYQVKIDELNKKNTLLTSEIEKLKTKIYEYELEIEKLENKTNESDKNNKDKDNKDKENENINKNIDNKKDIKNKNDKSTKKDLDKIEKTKSDKK